MGELDGAQQFRVDALGDEYRRRYGAAVEYLKLQVGEGEEFANEVARIHVSAGGAWFQCIELPMEFSGSTGQGVRYRFVSDSEAGGVAAGLNELVSSATEAETRDLGVLMLYDKVGIADDRNAFGAWLRPGERWSVRTVGAFQADRLPRAFRARIDTDLAIQGLSLKRGLIFGIASVGDGYLIVTIDFGNESVQNLTRAESSVTLPQ